MSAQHEHYLDTEGRFNPTWLEPVDSSLGRKVWRFPYILNFDGKRYDRVLEIDEKISSETADFVGRLATGWLVTVASQESSYSIHLALEQSSTVAEHTLALVTEAERITTLAAAQSQEQFAAAA